MAVLRRLGYGLAADHAIGAAAVVDDELATERFGQLLAHKAPHAVHAAAGREGDDDSYRAGWVALGNGLRAARDQGQRGRPLPWRVADGGWRKEKLRHSSPVTLFLPERAATPSSARGRRTPPP